MSLSGYVPKVVTQSSLSQACPYLSTWSAYGACDKTCGGGIRIRNRECIYGQPGEPGCDGDVIDVVPCNEQVRHLDLRLQILHGYTVCSISRTARDGSCGHSGQSVTCRAEVAPVRVNEFARTASQEKRAAKASPPRQTSAMWTRVQAGHVGPNGRLATSSAAAVCADAKGNVSQTPDSVLVPVCTKRPAMFS